MAFWDIDLTTRMGAQSAAQQGGLASYFVAGFSIVGGLVLGGLTELETAEAVSSAVGIGVAALVAAIAGFRLRAGKGAFWGIAVAVLLVIEVIGKLATFALGGIVLNVIFLVMVVQGVRGAWALRSESGFSEDDIEVFE